MTRIPLNRSVGIPLQYANRHGLITGATGTGKTVTLQTLAEGFSRAGVPVFVADVKTDLAALARSCPADILDLEGRSGRPIRTSVAGMGADLLARALELSDVQAGCLEISFAYAATHGLPLSTLADLRYLLGAVQDNREAVSREFGLVGAASIGAVRRALLRLSMQGTFFGSPPFDIAELLEPAGKVTILAADRLMQSPRLYSAFLLWLLTELYERMPEVGDLDKPRLVFFFDEAHLLFTDCPPALLRRIEQTVRLIRSKGVGVYFVTQSPDDVPAIVKAQLAHRIEHDRRLAIGTARFTTMNMAPVMVKVDMPACPLGPLSAAERAPFVPASMLAKVDRHAWDLEGLKAIAGLALAAVFFGWWIWG